MNKHDSKAESPDSSMKQESIFENAGTDKPASAHSEDGQQLDSQDIVDTQNGINESSCQETDALKKQIEQLTADLDEQKNKFLRLMADFENYKRRTAKERLELIQTAGKGVVLSMLEVLDDCDRAEDQIKNSTNIEQQKEGIALVFAKLRTKLVNQGLKEMECIQTPFDVEKHEAITEIVVDDAEKKGVVIDQVQKGYYLNDKLIRFAKVVVGK
ncbi:MAG: nucleotide exchange factor GrpE [Phycisphaerales bacterium]|nr:nucleotide exchange factor GrpE [Phycisphaerales bacterium]